MAPTSILFDMDGVLVKSEEAWFRCVEAAGRQFGTRRITREDFFPTFGQGTAADLVSFGLRCTAEELDRLYASEFLRHLGSVWVNPEAAPLLTELARRGIGCAVVTNTVGPLARHILAHAGLLEHFASIATADRVARAKPAPDLLLAACADLACAPAQAWMVGDSRFDRDAAAAAGVHFVGLGLAGDRRIDALGALLFLV